jgi:hypothetical protein
MLCWRGLATGSNIAFGAYSPKDQKMIKAAAGIPAQSGDQGARVDNGARHGRNACSFLQAVGSPTMVERVHTVRPQGQIEPISNLERSAIVESDGLRKYRAPAKRRDAVLASRTGSASGEAWGRLIDPARNEGRRLFAFCAAVQFSGGESRAPEALVTACVASAG